MTERELIRRLENSPVPPPPEDLAARIIKDIPAEIKLHPELEHEEHRRRFHRRPVWMAAAAAVTIALTGAVTWELRNQGPSMEIAGHQERHLMVLTPVDEVEGESEEAVFGHQVEGNTTIAKEPSLNDAEDRQGGRSTAPIENLPKVVLPEQLTVESPTAITDDQVQSGSAEGEDTSIANIVIVMKPATFSDQIIVAESPRVDTRGSSTSADKVILGREIRPEEWEKIGGKRRQTSGEIVVSAQAPVVDSYSLSQKTQNEPKKLKDEAFAASPSTGGNVEPNDQPYGDVFFEHTGVNPFVDTEDDHLSTFGLDVDTGSFTVARRYLRDGNMPPRAAIRVEEFVNTFDYGDEPPRKADFRLIVEGAPSAFASSERTYTLRLAVKAREVDAADRPPVVLVFCVDVSGSMNRENRLGLVKKALYELLENLRRDDHVGLVVYGTTGRVLLKPTTDHEAIRRAIEGLSAGGSTNAEEGLVLAYDLLSDGDADGRIRRVILCSDGVANVGRTGPDSILERIRREAGEGIELTTVGFGMGNYNDTLMEQLADTGNGRYAYVDQLDEARRIFVEELTGTLLTLGHDAKAQVEFDPDVVSRWRLLGYENRDIADHLFRDPSVDAGEIGAGHTVTALYEVKLLPKVGRRDRVATLRLRYRPMGETREIELDETLRVSHLAKSWDDASPALKLASSVAEFAEILKGAYWAKDGDLDDVLRQVRRLQAEGFEGDGRVAELGAMVSEARRLTGTVSR